MLPSLLLALAAAAPARDTYPRQPVDAEHYRFALTLSDSVDRIEGEARVRLRVTAAGVTSVFLDLANATPARSGKGMTVSGVTLGATPLAFRHADDRLTMTLPAASTLGQVLELTVRYRGIPADGLQIKPTRHGDRAFFSDDWPNKARQWLPTIDHVGDKATMEMAVTAPAHYQVISNGRRVEETDMPDATRRTVWLQSVPISPWLYVLGVARFAVQSLGDYRGIPLETWVFARDRDAGFHDFAVPVKDAMAFYSEFVGPYAYEKLANVQSTATGGGMEAATAIMYDQRSVDGTRSLRWRNVIIHEIAHQWFGNAVTEADWNDVWLSEGFATYFTSLFIEHAYGRDEFAQVMRDSRKTIVDFYAKQPDYRVVHENLSDMAQVTTGMTYQKGAWVLHMLRQRIGDDRFWAGIRDYYARYMNGTATTTDFRRVMERASGQDLTAFFEQWLYRGQIPRIEGSWRWDAAAREVVVEMRQVQPGPAFSMELEVAVEGGGATPVVQRANVGSAPTQLRLAASERPGAVTLDPMVRTLFTGTLQARPD
ncbi:MAG: M1 family metallopeptidase [Gemmatimonadetes bacterium]|nr:M1 family metallopeptidase [Gemmatimonadota bacterium]